MTEIVATSARVTPDFVRQLNENFAALPSFSIMRRRYIDVLDYVPSSDADPAGSAAGIDAALALGANREVVFSQPLSSTYNYRVLSRSNAEFVIPDGCRLIWEAPVDVSGIGIEGAQKEFFKGEGSVSATRPLASNATAGDSTLTGTSGTVAALVLAAGDYIRPSSDARFPVGDDAATTAEYVRIQSISGEVITIYGVLRGSYATADNAVIQKVTFKSGIRVENPLIIGPGRFETDPGDIGLALELCRNSSIVGGEITRCDYNAIRLKDVIDSVAGWTTIRHDPVGGTNTEIQYGVTYMNGCQGLRLEKFDIYGGKHGIVQSRSNSPGATRDVSIMWNTITGTYQDAIATHENAELITAAYNDIRGCASGFDIRVRKCQSSNNKVRGLPNANPGIGFKLSKYIDEFTSHNDLVEGGRYAIQLAASDAQLSGSPGPINISIVDLKAIGQRQRPIDLVYDDTTDAKKGLNIVNPTCRGHTGVAIYVEGTFNAGSIEAGKIYRLNRGAWVTATDYEIGDRVTEAGVGYLCLIAHTSGTFATDLAAARWEVASGSPIQTVDVENFDVERNKWDEHYANSLSLAGTSIKQSNNGRFGQIPWRPEYAVIGEDVDMGVVTSSTTETEMSRITIPARTWAAKGSVIATFNGEHSNNANTKTYRIRIGPAGTALASLTAIPCAFAVTTSASIHHQTEIFSDTTTAQIGQAAAGNAWGVSGAAPVTTAVDQNTDLDIVLSAECANGADTAEANSFKVEVFNPPLA